MRKNEPKAACKSRSGTESSAHRKVAGAWLGPRMQAGLRSRYRRNCGARACPEHQLGNERAIQAPLAGRVACPAHARDRAVFPSSSEAQAGRKKLGAPKGNELTPPPTPASFSNQDAEWLSCSKLLNQIDLQAKGRSGGMADAADSKSVGRKPVKVRLLSPAVLPFFPWKNSDF